MRTQALTITLLFCLAGWGSCARDGMDHPTKDDAGSPADDGGTGPAEKAEEPAPAAEVKAPEASEPVKAAPAMEAAK